MIVVTVAVLLLLTSCTYGLTDGSSSTQPDVSQEVSSSVSSALPETSAAESAAVSSQTDSKPAESKAGSSSEEAVPVNAGDKWNLILVNRAHPLPESFKVDLSEIKGSAYDVDSRVVENLDDMLAAAKKDGMKLQVISAYRSVAKQKTLYSQKVSEYVKLGYSQKDAEAEAARWVAVPNTSEHHTGLASDIVGVEWYQKHGDLDDTFDQTEEFKWLISHCTEYGFVLRYPKDKQDITGITYEPWHYRYVGKETAEYMTKNNLCLEEYWEKQ
ncbi:D-Ala-D-Ala carboxypeptidase. Metallo peptidase. MEROPS family M15B [Acetanaerobacterium elongatum]|uniref:D-Ala-D-Ala carboxypeptidase. Metallo peptidase. MEROPS family M15B n=2 Tax=Acetanaerobacterium elongatum TaxID=258515 RepID=A0A1G9U325_9FIRM|nr:D-Ala-D-Ala carboxypeptidase. Metallo peptidase. MEROPS family M15B [Acetanaerobacterium elongatum]